MLIAIVIALAFLGAHGSRIVDHLPLLSVEAVAGFIAGMQLGRMASYGQLTQLLKREEIVWRVVPGHANGAGGLKPIGNFYLYQAGILGLAAAFLAIWWAIIPWWPQYAEWRTPYLALLGVVMLLAILIFAVPIFSFHREMHRQKQSRQGEADDMERAMEDMRAQLAGETDADARQSIEQRLAYMNERRRAIRQMPTWPL